MHKIHYIRAVFDIYLLLLKNPHRYKIYENRARNRSPASIASKRIHKGTPSPPIPPKSPEVFNAITLDVTVKVLRPRYDGSTLCGSSDILATMRELISYS